MNASPRVVVIAGPNGAGKSTAAPHILRGVLGVNKFVNADTIARGLSAYSPETVAFEAGRIMLKRMTELEEHRSDFAFETTLATRSFAPRLRRLKAKGYKTNLVFLSLPSAELAVQRVHDRVAQGGHRVPDDIVRQRYHRGLKNLFTIYMPLVDHWRVYDNAADEPRLIAQQQVERDTMIADINSWQSLKVQQATP